VVAVQVLPGKVIMVALEAPVSHTARAVAAAQGRQAVRVMAARAVLGRRLVFLDHQLHMPVAAVAVTNKLLPVLAARVEVVMVDHLRAVLPLLPTRAAAVVVLAASLLVLAATVVRAS
jgi:hypothetical protein